MKITYTKQAARTLRRMQPRTARRILTAIEKLADNPARADLDVRALQGRDGCRLRVGGWRIIYSQDGMALTIESIAPRGKAYKFKETT